MANFNFSGDTSVFKRIKTQKVEMMYTKYNEGELEINFIVNGYKLHLDDLERFQIKQIVKEKYSKYRFVSNAAKKLQKDIPECAAPDGPKWIKTRCKQITTLIRTLIWQLRNTKTIDEDLELLFGTSDWDPMFTNIVALFPKGLLICSPIKAEWEEDYLEVYKKEQIGA